MIFQIGKPRGRQQVEDIGEPNLSSQTESENGGESDEDAESEEHEKVSEVHTHPKGKLTEFLIKKKEFHHTFSLICIKRCDCSHATRINGLDDEAMFSTHHDFVLGFS